MQRQQHIPFLNDPVIFAEVFKHLDPSAIGPLALSCRQAAANTALCQSNTTRLLCMLGKMNRVQAAQFFAFHRYLLGVKVGLFLQADPENYEAYTLYLLMSVVNTNMIDLEKLQRTLTYLKQAQFPERIIQSLEFIAAFLTLPAASPDISHLFPRGKQFYINLRGANLDSKSIIDCDLTGADLFQACLSEVDARNCNFSYANMEGVIATLSRFDNAIFIGTHVSKMKEDLGFPHEPRFTKVRFFKNREETAANKALTFYSHESDIPSYIIDALANDLADNGDDTHPGATIPVLEKAMHDPLFATHSEPVVGFINRYLFTVFTNQQKVLADQIKALKTVAELEAAEPVNKKMK